MAGCCSTSAPNPCSVFCREHGNLRKRHSSSVLPQTLKRARSNTLSIFTPKEQSIIKNTASIFQIKPGDLADAIDSLRKRNNSAPISDHEGEVLPHILLRPEDNPSQTGLRYLEMEPSNDNPDFGFPMDQPLATSDSRFGFNLTPSAWSNCFAELSTNDGQQTFGAGHEAPNSHYFLNNNLHVTNHDGQQRLIPTSQGDYRYDCVDPTFDLVALYENLFTCDLPYATPSWEPSEFNSQSVNGSSIQPPTPRSSMVYPQPRTNKGTSEKPTMTAISNIPENLRNSLITPLTASIEKSAPLLELPHQTYAAINGSDSEGVGTRARRGPFKSPHARAQTAQTRRNNACLRCRMQRVRCIPDLVDPKGVCLTCKKVSTQKMITKLPCLRYKITDTRLYRVGYVTGHSWSNRWRNMEMNDISTWADSQIRTIQITQDYISSPLALRVRKFAPVEGDMLRRQWVHGNIKKSVKLPHYAIANLKEAEKAYKEYITNEGKHFFFSNVQPKHGLLWETYNMAMGPTRSSMTEQETILLNLVLRLWVCVRMITRSERICGSDTLGMRSNIMDQSSPMHGKIPITPVMGAQIDVILIQGILTPLRGMILDQLQKLVLAHKPQNWLCIYFCIFILLHNNSLIVKQDMAYARKHGLKTRFAMVSIVEELHMGANIFLAYYHYCCKGFRPFALDWNASETLSMAELDLDQIKFVEKTAGFVESNKSKFRDLKENDKYDDDHYYVAQLYEEDWTPSAIIT